MQKHLTAGLLCLVFMFSVINSYENILNENSTITKIDKSKIKRPGEG